ncbi:peptidase S10 [Alteromonas sp. LMIT006]|jgi:carboxypeptidase C (cathepsin A)|uniref:S10 family peptidase n=1 Tax=Alteromonadaceae TaxID=72275 RepID=UPI0020CA92F2|nr:peptidase S10 [Alteromonas sp. LMIT006]UTP73090.1 peptidase S10 [Alteromonas sp. LMIT006]
MKLAIIICSVFALCVTSTMTLAESTSVPEPVRSITEHSIKIQDKTIKYEVIAGDTHILNEAGEAIANIFSTAYFRTNTKNPNRPVLFIFNGGPGSSSVWLHMGIYGPKKVVIGSDAEAVGSPPYAILDNPDSLIDIADMVFIDPPGTGYSRAIGVGENKDFWGVKEDAVIMSEFVRSFTREYNLFNRPKYLSGESYGTTRAGAMVKELQEGWGSYDLSGVFLISSIVDFQTGDFKAGNDLPYITFLPTYAATAWYHQAIDRTGFVSLEAFLDEVREFALNDYATTLLKGQRATDLERFEVSKQLQRFTGLSAEFLRLSNLRINEFQFMKALLRERGIRVGRLDSRYVGQNTDNISYQFEADPSAYAIDGAYTAAINDYFRTELNVKRNVRYHILSGNVFSNWNWLYERNARSQGFLNVTPFLATAQKQNKDFRIFVANGYYDLATPFFATEHSMHHNDIDLSRVTMKYYEAGHMMYIHHPSLKALADDMRAFLTQE